MQVGHSPGSTNHYEDLRELGASYQQFNLNHFSLTLGVAWLVGNFLVTLFIVSLFQENFGRWLMVPPLY